MRRAALAVRGFAEQQPGTGEIVSMICLWVDGMVIHLSLESAEQLRTSLDAARIDALAAASAIASNPALAAAVPAGRA